MAKAFTWASAAPGTCKFHALGACTVDPISGQIKRGEQYTWNRSGQSEHWHVQCPSEDALQPFASKWAGKCIKCNQAFPVGTLIRWHPSTHKAWHAVCPDAASASTPPKAAEAAGANAESMESTLRASIEAANALKAAQAAQRAQTPTPPTPPAAHSVETWNAESSLAEAIRVIAASVAPPAAALDEARVIALIAEHTPASPVHTIEVKRPDLPTINMGVQHTMFPALLRKCSALTADGKRCNIWLAGPAGTGKTSAARKCAEALSLPFASMGSIQDPTQLIGYVSPVTGNYMSTPFRKAFEHGGVILLDEIDASDSNALLCLNQALANTHFMFPDGVEIERHADCIVICAANTYGLGGTHDYVGRMKQDAAFLDRFLFQDWPVDETFETALCSDARWCAHVQRIRATAHKQGVRVVISPRASLLGAAMLAAGASWEETEAATLRRGMTDEQWTALRGGA